MGDMASSLQERMAQLRLQNREAFKQRLLDAGAQQDEAEACFQLFSRVEEALPYITTADDGRKGYKSPWQEYYSLKFKRFYYCNDAIGYNSWEMHPKMQLAEWLVDVSLYGVEVKFARDAYATLRRLLDPSWHRVDALWECVEIMSRLVGNVAGCSNSVEKYRCIKMDNPKIKDKVLSMPGAFEVLQLAGFVRGSVSLNFPADATSSETLKPCTLVAAKLEQLASRKGFTGSAKQSDDLGTDSTSSSSSKHAGKPGFRYQLVIHECSVCERPINDGTDRLRTRAFDTPRGEMRFECQQCPSFNLCETCFDRVAGGEQLHTAGHTYHTHHPREAQHNLPNNASDSNPWGNFQAGPGLGRALQRLGDRHGITEWH